MPRAFVKKKVKTYPFPMTTCRTQKLPGPPSQQSDWEQSLCLSCCQLQHFTLNSTVSASWRQYWESVNTSSGTLVLNRSRLGEPVTGVDDRLFSSSPKPCASGKVEMELELSGSSQSLSWPRKRQRTPANFHLYFTFGRRIPNVLNVKKIFDPQKSKSQPLASLEKQQHGTQETSWTASTWEAQGPPECPAVVSVDPGAS